MAVARNADGRMEVFARGNDYKLVQIHQVGPNTGWADEWGVLGALGGGDMLSIPAVGRNADGRLEVFTLGNEHTLWHIWQTVPNGPWSPWHSLGGFLVGAPVVAHNADMRLEVFGIGPDGGLYHMSQDTSQPNGWSPWASLGHPRDLPLRQTLSPEFPHFDVSRNSDGRLEAFVIAGDAALWHTWANEPNSRGPWSSWACLGPLLPGEPSGPDDLLGRVPAVVRTSDGRLELFATTLAGRRLLHKWQIAPSNGWSLGWDDLGGTLTSSPAVSKNADGRLEVFGRGSDNYIWHIWQTAPNNGWSNWESLGGWDITAELGQGPDAAGALTVGQNADGRLQLFVSSRGHVSTIWQARSGWSPWRPLGNAYLTFGALGRGLIEPF